MFLEFVTVFSCIFYPWKVDKIRQYIRALLNRVPEWSMILKIVNSDKISISEVCFQVSLKETKLNDLKKQLNWDFEHLAKPLEGTNFNYGFNTDYLKDVIVYWRDKYDWRAEEQKINAMSKYKLKSKLVFLLRVGHPKNPAGCFGLSVLGFLGFSGLFQNYLNFTLEVGEYQFL